MNQDIKYSMLVLEGLQIDWQLDEDVLALIKAVMVESSQIDEGILDTIKDKASNFAEKVVSTTKNILPSINQKFENVLNQVRAKQGDEVADEIETQMNKKGGANWKGSAQKVAAALVVASTLAQASPVEAREMFMRISPFQAQQMQMQRQAELSRRQHMGQQFYMQQRRDDPRFFHQDNRGGDAAALAIGVMIGAALGAALSQAPQQ